MLRTLPKIVSDEFVLAVKTSPDPAYALAIRAGLPSPVLSRVLHGNAKTLSLATRQKLEMLGEHLGLTPQQVWARQERP